MVRVTTPHVDSQKASQRTRYRRSGEINSIRQVVRGGPQIQQFQDEVHTLSEDERRQLLLQSKPLQIQIPVEEGLAMKADLGIPWNEMRTLRRLHDISSTNLNKYDFTRWMKAWEVLQARESQGPCQRSSLAATFHLKLPCFHVHWRVVARSSDLPHLYMSQISRGRFSNYWNRMTGIYSVTFVTNI